MTGVSQTTRVQVFVRTNSRCSCELPVHSNYQNHNHILQKCIIFYYNNINFIFKDIDFALECVEFELPVWTGSKGHIR